LEKIFFRIKITSFQFCEHIAAVLDVPNQFKSKLIATNIHKMKDIHSKSSGFRVQSYLIRNIKFF